MKTDYLKAYVNAENIELKLFVNDKGRFAVRLYDLDARQTVTVWAFNQYEQASDHFDKMVRGDIGDVRKSDKT